MSYRILPTKQFEKDFKKLNSESQSRIKKKMSGVAENPERYKHLHYDLNNYSRVRVGKLRVIFSYDVKKQELYLRKIVFGHRY